MRVRLDKPIPRSFSARRDARGIVGERDFGIYGSRLRAKLLVFETVGSMRAFWRRALGKGLGTKVRAAVSPLEVRVEYCAPKGERAPAPFLRCDPRYFCVVGLCKKHLTAEVIGHEAVHVGYAYARRVKASRRWWRDAANRNDEEVLAYPTGSAAEEMTHALYALGFWKSG